MNRLIPTFLIACVFLICAPNVNAELMLHEFGAAAERTIDSLGTKLILACVVLAAGKVIAAVIVKRKGC